MYQQNVNNISNAMASVHHNHHQLAEGKKLLTPSDDPANTSQALSCRHTLTGIKQHGIAREYASNTLGYEDSALNGMSYLLTNNLIEKIVAAGNGTYSTEKKTILANELQNIRDSLINLANSKNSHGRYIFSGYKTTSQPFSPVEGSYSGGNKAMTQWIDDGLEMQISHLGSDIFISEKHGNLFERLSDTVAALKDDSEDAQETLSLVLQQMNQSINYSMDSLGKIQTSVGANLQMLERLGFNSDINAIRVIENYQENIGSDEKSKIQLHSELFITEQALQSSMLLFKSMKDISLFNMI
jgi:flagellar hook-associated protein 3 FlgL